MDKLHKENDERTKNVNALNRTGILLLLFHHLPSMTLEDDHSIRVGTSMPPANDGTTLRNWLRMLMNKDATSELKMTHLSQSTLEALHQSSGNCSTATLAHICLLYTSDAADD